MKILNRWAALAALIAAFGNASANDKKLGHPGRHEVWVMDQSDTVAPAAPGGLGSGGTLFIYEGSTLAGEGQGGPVAEVINFGGQVREMAIARTGSAPTRPHMVYFNTSGTHAIVSFVASGHVLFMNALTREPLDIIDVGAQAHAAVPTADEQHVIVANQNGKLLQRIRTDYAQNIFTLENDATLDLRNGVTPSGAPKEAAGLRPDNAPICIGIASGDQLAFVTLRGGGLFVVDIAVTPMEIVAEYDSGVVGPHGCGTVEVNGKMYVNSGAGTIAGQPTHHARLYTFLLDSFSTPPSGPNLPAPALIYESDDQHEADAHGLIALKQNRYIWMADREANHITVFDPVTDQQVNTIHLETGITPDPAPDLFALAPAGNRIYVTLRGPNPLSGGHAAFGSTPGLGVIRVEQGGRTGTLMGLAPMTHVVNGIERADPHGIAVRSK